MPEILSRILDILAVPELISFACVSRRMREMVYDDTRWIQRLRLMGCWDDAEARKRGEEAARRKLEGLNARHEEQLKQTGTGINGVNGTHDGFEKHEGSTTSVFDSQWTEGKDDGLGRGQHEARHSTLDDGFDSIILSPTNNKTSHVPEPRDSASILDIMARARSSRGAARQEYGKIHGAIAPFYSDAIRSKSHTNAKIFRVYRDPCQQAQMLSQLVKFSKSDVSQGWQQRGHRLADLVVAFEDAVAGEFDQGLEYGDVEGRMKKYARVLVTLNGGQRAIDHYISENPVIKEKAALGDPMDCIHVNHSGGLSLSESHAFFSHLSAAFNAQVVIIDRVFPATANVVIPFLKKIGTDVIGAYLNSLFDEVRTRNLESFLQAVSGTYEQTLRFAKSLQPTHLSGDDFYETVDRVIASVFEPYITLYLSEELEFFKQRSDAEVSDWERRLSEQDASMQSMYMSNVNRQADKRDFLKSFKKVVMMPVNVLPSFPMSSPFGGKSVTAKALVNDYTLETSQLDSSQVSTRPGTPSLMNGAAPPVSRSSTPVPEPPTTELAAKAAIMNSRLEGIRSLFSLEIALSLVHMAKASIERAAVFVKPLSQFEADARKQCQTIFVLLLQILGTRHVKTGFDQAVEHLSKYNPRQTSEHNQLGVAPLVVFLELVNVGDLIQQMLDVFYEQELVATKLTDRNDFMDPAAKEKKRFEQMLDERVAAGLNKGIEVLMAEVEYICATTQKPEDFNPDTSGDAHKKVIDIGISQTATQVVDVMSSHTKMLIGSTDKNMLDVFNQEVGLRLFTALCKHLKRQRVSVDGSIKLIRYAVQRCHV